MPDLAARGCILATHSGKLMPEGSLVSFLTMKLPRWLFGVALPLALRAADFDVAVATNQVGLDLFRQLARAQANTNLIISPYSIESALALAFAGADGTTRTEMARALRLSDDADAVERGFAGRATMMAEGADAWADGTGATPVELIYQPAVARLGRLLEVDGKRDFPGG